MLTRDYILRQVQQAVNVLSQVVMRREALEYHIAQDILSQTIQEIAGADPEIIRGMNRNELVDICRQDGVFYSEKAIALADLFREDGFIHDATGDSDTAVRSWTRSIWLYEEASRAGGTVPLDLPDRLAEMAAMLQSNQ